jgi:tetratricopeptide (TPR) repeat protein
MSTYNPSFGADLEARRRQAIKAVDSLLYRKARGLPGSLPPNHPARIERWVLPLRDEGGVLVRGSPEEFARLTPLARYLEVVRAEAEALLVHEQLGFVLLNEKVRDELTLRALGIIPGNEGARFAEISGYHDLSPRHIMVDIPHFMAGIKAIEACYGLGTALCYGLLLVTGVRTRDEVVKYGEMLQALFDRLTLDPDLARTLSRVAESGLRRADFDTQFSVLTQLRDRLWRELPRHPGIEFRLHRALEAAARKGGTFAVSPLAHVALDAIVLGKMGFSVRLYVSEPNLDLELTIATKTVYWESETRAEMSFIPLHGGDSREVYDFFVRTYHQIGVWNSRQGQMTKAVAAFKQALILDRDQPEIYNDLGHAYLRSNQPNEAIEACQQAVALAPDYADAYVTLASGYLTRNHADEAIDALKKAIRIKPNLAEAFNNLGFAYDLKGESDKAVTSYKTAIRLRPDYAHSCYNLGNSYLNSRKYDLAIEAYQRTVRLNPKFVRAWYNLGQAFYQRRMLNDATEAYKRVLQINPKHAGALYNLGIIYRDQGMTEKAVETLERAVALNPNLLR